MFIHADLSCRVSVKPDQHTWVSSPQAGVERMMLDRIGAEKARATSIVTYAPNSYFPRHQHPGGEEILVLSGTFSDESGDYSAGSYVRNPPGSGHQPFSQSGAKILVKLWQMPAQEKRHVVVDTENRPAWQKVPGGETCLLFSADYEQVSLQTMQAAVNVNGAAQGGAEFFVLAGELILDGETFVSGSWLRMPDNDTAAVITGVNGATFYLKTGHLQHTGMSV